MMKDGMAGFELHQPSRIEEVFELVLDLVLPLSLGQLGVAAGGGLVAEIERASTASVESLPSATRAVLESYAAGVNARIEGIFDVTFDDGRVPLEPIPVLTAGDCTRMRQLGFNLLRLPINWSAIEPTRGNYDAAYLDAVQAAVDCAADA